MTVVAFTGHRPKDLGGYNPEQELNQWVRDMLRRAIRFAKPEKCISGMALGVDTWAAEVCNELEIPWIAAVPFAGQESRWPEQSQRHFRSLLKTASEVVVVSEGTYSAAKMQVRNEYMVDNADIVIAVWDGDTQRRSGTRNCVEYAQSQGKRIFHINPRTRTMKELEVTA